MCFKHTAALYLTLLLLVVSAVALGCGDSAAASLLSFATGLLALFATRESEEQE
jgi:hypothetical protein